jgi:predicted RNase H-like nuclease (RuvC/YqgF family)
MARATFVKAAQKDIYTNGKYVKYTSQKGKRAGQEKTKLDRTQPKDKSDTVMIAKGESYWWWAFKNGGKHYSKTKPKRSQLTQSNYLSQLYGIQDRMDELSFDEPEDLESILDEFKSDLENLKDECQNSLDNMPESLQSSPTGELLQERIDALDNAISEFDNIDTDYEDPDDEELKGELDEDATQEDIDNLRQEKKQEWIDEKISDIQNISLEG